MTYPPPPGPGDPDSPAPAYQQPVEAYTPPPDPTYQAPDLGTAQPWNQGYPQPPSQGPQQPADEGHQQPRPPYPPQPGTAYPPQPGPAYPPAAPGYPPAYPQYGGQTYQPPDQSYPAPAYQYGYPDPYAYAPPRPTDALAITSLVISCVAIPALCLYGFAGLLGVVGAILGHVSRRRIRTTGAAGEGMALAGIIVGWIAAVLALLIGIGFILLIVHSVHTGDFEAPTPITTT